MTVLPDGWRWQSLNELAADGVFVDGDWVESKDQDPGGSVRLTQLADVGVAHFRDRSDRWLREDQAERLSCTRLVPGDILIARMPDPIGRACMVPEGIGAAVSVVDVAILRLRRTDVDARYVMWAINAPEFHQSVVAKASGTTRKRISRRNLGLLQVPLPSIEEQRRIVDLLEDHLSRLDAAARSLALADKRSEALDRSGRQKLWNEAKAAGGLVPIVNFGRVVTGATPREESGDEQTDPQGFLTPSDIENGREITSTNRIFPSAAVARARSSFGPAAYAVCIGATLGKTGWSTQPVGFNQQINAVVTTDARDAHLLATLMAAPVFQEQMWAEASATTMPILNKGRFMKLMVPSPPTDLRTKLLSDLEELASANTRLRDQVQRSTVRLGSLRRALLHAAFSGQLSHPFRAQEEFLV